MPSQVSRRVITVLASPVTYALNNRRYGKAFNVLDNLSADGIRVDAYVAHADDLPRPENVTVHETGSKNKLGYYVSAFQEARRQLKSERVDIYHHMNLSYRWFNPLLLADTQNDTPTVIGPCQGGHEIMAREFNRMLTHAVGKELPKRLTDPIHSGVDAVRSILDPGRLWLFGETLQRADRIIVVHEEAKEEYTRFVDESKLKVIPLGVNPETFTYSERPNTSDLVAIGSLSERKGYDDLLNAMGPITTEFPDARLHVFGEGPLEAELCERTRQLGIADAVTFHGFVDQSVVREHLKRARAFVHPSLSESFSLVRLEAMATGCPVVVSDISGAREMVRDGKEGYVVPKRSSDRIVAAVSTLLADHERAKQMGKRARERVEERYDWRRIGEQYLDVYRTLA
jgi:glycosyltransferase involved in cell wall biosynthesis